MTEGQTQALICAQNAALREEITREIADLPQADLRGVLRMIAVWKGRAVQPDAHVNETPKSEHEARDVLTTAAKGGDA